jgi:hypothetical protein
MEFILILVFYAGMLAKGDSMAMISIPFNSQAECQAAGEGAKKLETTYKTVNYVCVPRSRYSQ